MKKKTILGYYLSLVVLCTGILVSCDDDPEIDSVDKDEKLYPILEQYVNHTVIPTYKSLADESITLYNAVKAFKDEKTDANLKKVTDQWIQTREYWELSEAFLFGAVDDYGIDPHIDTWPIGEEELSNLLKNSKAIEALSGEKGELYASETLKETSRGFHGIEYIFFREGKPREANQISEEELIYVLAVTGDLRNKCVHLEGAWAGHNAITKEKQELADRLELQLSLKDGGNKTYKENLLSAGKSSTYTSITAGVLQILDGCTTISEEVGDQKLGNAYRGDDKNYLESPYSYNSLEDFEDNIVSIQNAYLGGADANNRGASVSDYVKSINPQADSKVKEAANNAIAKIQAIPFPFEKNFTSTQVAEAMSACDELTKALNQAKDIVQKGE